MILFITRKHPPSIGGMQKLSYELTSQLATLTDVRVISWGGSQAFLPLFLPYAFLRAVWELLRMGKVQLMHVSDPVLSPLGLALKSIFKLPVATTIHGLDIIFPHPLYQSIVAFCLKRIDALICISECVRNECIRRGIPEQRCSVIPPGVALWSESESSSARKRTLIGSITGRDLTKAKILLTVGRLVKRKGVREFIVDTLPQILRKKNDIHYIIVGHGPQRSLIKREIARLKLQEKISLLGQVDEKALQALYDAADIVVLPNIPVEGDVEGFGIVALEACARGVCVVAARLEGLQEAIREGENGFLVEPGDSTAYTDIIVRLLEDDQAREDFGARARDFVAQNNSWTRVGERYYMLFQRLCEARGTKLPSSEILP